MANSKKATAGLRGAQWDAARLPANTELMAHQPVAADGGSSQGFLFRVGRPRTVVCIMHPREVLVGHYLVPDILEAGAAAWIQAPRSPGNDVRLEHEIALLDVAAGLNLLNEQGFERIILLGNSGGAGLYAFYNEQSVLAPEDRFDRTPAGRPTHLREAVMPIADGMIFVSPHPGPGILLMNALDPSVTDEHDPFSRDAALDPFDPANGYGNSPAGASYAAEFVEHYRVAQRARVARIDALARAHIALRQDARARLKTGSADRDIRIKAAHAQLMTIWRTDADLRCFDLKLDPSSRKLGSLWSRDPYVSNWGAVGFARVCTPESWLSTWSGISSRASVPRCAPAISQPSLMIEYSGDNCVFPADADNIFKAIAAADKTRIAIDGDHHGRRISESTTDGQLEAGRAIGSWINPRFPALG